MATTDITINIDNELKDRAQHVFENLGLDMSTAINMILRKALFPSEASFDISTSKISRRAAFGCLKGKINVPEDFNEPLDDFKEYM